MKQVNRPGLTGSEQRRGGQIRACIQGWRESFVHTQGHDGDAIAVDETVRQQFVAHGRGIAADVRSLTEPGEYPSRQHLEPLRARLRVGQKDTTEGVQVVTCHYGASRGKRMNEVTVAVIDDVKEVETPSDRSEMPRIVEDSIDQSVRRPARPGGRHPASREA
jgi:hypothetical protein